MIEDLNKLICDNGICSIDSEFSEHDSWVSYETEDYEENYDYDASLKETVNHSFSYCENSLFNVLINGLPNINPEELSIMVKDVSFDNNNINLTLLPTEKIAKLLYKIAYEENDYFLKRKRTGFEIIIEVFDKTGEIIMKHKFYNCLVTSFSQTLDDIMETKLEFVYDYYENIK